jgi:hypothetical protein
VPQLLVVCARANVRHFAYHIVQNLSGDGAEELVAGHLPGVEVNAGQLSVVVQHALKVGGTVQYVWVAADSQVGDEPSLQRTDSQVIVEAG